MTGSRLWFLADKLAEQIRAAAAYPQNLPIENVEDLANRFGAQVESREIDEAGRLRFGAEGVVITARSDDPRVRQRFSICHELVHLALRDPQISGAPGRDASAYFRSTERLCDCTAAALLMPHWWVVNAFARAGRGTGSLGDALALAAAADVSPAAAFLRLHLLGSSSTVMGQWQQGPRGWVLWTDIGTLDHGTSAFRMPPPAQFDLLRIYVTATALPDGEIVRDSLPLGSGGRGESVPGEFIATSRRARTLTGVFDTTLVTQQRRYEALVA